MNLFIESGKTAFPEISNFYAKNHKSQNQIGNLNGNLYLWLRSFRNSTILRKYAPIIEQPFFPIKCDEINDLYKSHRQVPIGGFFITVRKN